MEPHMAAILAPPGKPMQPRGGPLAVEAQPIDHRLVTVEPKETGARVARLRQGCDGADLDEAETQLEERVSHLGMLVEARGHTDRIGKVEAEGTHRKARVIRGQLHEWRDLSRPGGKPMRVPLDRP